jgi:hypothetical protein
LFPETSTSLSPWKIANVLYNSSFTFYVYPDGSLHAGNTISDWSKVPLRSKVLVAYRPIAPPQTRNRLGEDLEDLYLASQTVYLSPDRTIKAGDQIQLDKREEQIAGLILREIKSRVRFLDEVGLGYLTLDRPSAQLHSRISC